MRKKITVFLAAGALCATAALLWALAPRAERPRMVALTFDDGPHPAYTAELLDILEEHGAAATFFELGTNVSKCPEQLARAVSLGCEIGSHSYAHDNLAEMEPDAMRADLAAADEQFIQAAGQAPVLLRPPGGQFSQRLQEECGKAVVTWSIDTQDWKFRDAETIVDYVKGQERLEGQVILMHSIYPSSVEAARVLIPWLQEQGYRLVTVSELIEARTGERPQAGMLYNYKFFAQR